MKFLLFYSSVINDLLLTPMIYAQLTYILSVKIFIFMYFVII